MKHTLIATALLLLTSAATARAAGPAPDWAGHERYADANATLTHAPEVVFMGNSITDGWDDTHPAFFSANNFACRGISGQVTAQMLCRFKADVTDLKPHAVVILGGVNDICGNNGPVDMRHILDNISAMVSLARAAGITPLVGSPLPTDYAFWRPELKGLGKSVRTYYEALRRLCREINVTFIDFYPAMADADGGILPNLSNDRLHPNAAGYDVMEPIVLKALALHGIGSARP